MQSTNPGDITAWRQQYQIQYSDESARVGSIDPHRQTMVDLEYFIRELRDGGHEVVVFLDANINESRSLDHKLRTGNSNRALALTLTELSMGL
jgi:hypothetical protein